MVDGKLVWKFPSPSLDGGAVLSKKFQLDDFAISQWLRTSLSVVLSSSFLHADAHTDFCDGVSMMATAVLAQDRVHVSHKHIMVAELGL